MSRTGMPPRRGAVIVESAFVYPVMIFLLLFLIVGGVAVFRYQQVAWMAREAARWASVRGADYQRYVDADSPTESEILENAVWPLLAGMEKENLTVQTEWVDQATGTAAAWDGAVKDVKSINALGEYVTNSIRVTVTYQWSLDLPFMGALQLKSTAEVPMSF